MSCTCAFLSSLSICWFCLSNSSPISCAIPFKLPNTSPTTLKDKVQITYNSKWQNIHDYLLKIFFHFIFSFIIGHSFNIFSSWPVATMWLFPNRVIMVFIYSAIGRLVLSTLVDTSNTVPWTHTTTTTLLNFMKMAIRFYDRSIITSFLLEQTMLLTF